MTHPAEGKLLPCPFCGAQPTTDRAGVPGKFGPIPTVRCTNEECFGPHTTAQFLADAVKQWNTRHSQGGNAAEPAAWLVGWHRANGDAGLKAYVNEDDARKAAKNLEAYSASETMTDVQPLYAAPTPSPAEKKRGVQLPNAAASILADLVEALERCHASPEYQSVWTISQIHQGVYDGPKYDQEFAMARMFVRSLPTTPLSREEGSKA